MNTSTATELLQIAEECKKEWPQKLFLLQDGTWINVSSTAAGKKSVTPSAATNQPSIYPRDSVYRLDTQFCGSEKLDDVKNMMRQPECHPGCILILSPPKNTSFCLLPA